LLACSRACGAPRLWGERGWGKMWTATKLTKMDLKAVTRAHFEARPRPAAWILVRKRQPAPHPWRLMADCLLIHGEILFRQLTCNAVPIPDWLSPRLLAPAAAKLEEGKAAEEAEHEKAAADATAELAAEEAASAAAAAGAAAKAAAELPATTTDEDYLPEKVELSDSPEALPVKSIPAEDEGEDGDDDAAQPPDSSRVYPSRHGRAVQAKARLAKEAAQSKKEKEERNSNDENSVTAEFSTEALVESVRKMRAKDPLISNKAILSALKKEHKAWPVTAKDVRDAVGKLR